MDMVRSVKLDGYSVSVEFFDLKPFVPALVSAAWISMGPNERRKWNALGAGLAVTAVVELLAYTLVCFERENHWLYNLYLCAQVPLGAWLVRSMSNDAALRKYAWAGVLVSGGFALWEVLGSGTFRLLFTRLGMLNNMVLAVLFTWLLFEQASRSRPLFAQAPFWLVVAHLMYVGCTLPLTGLLNYLNERNLGLSSRLYVVHDVVFALFHAVVLMLLIGPFRRPLNHHSP